ncbi:MAG: recombinase family protein, partial [Bacteroidales bacterium]|nr:recombinase family protein [Bacteroidales bacterium]
MKYFVYIRKSIEDEERQVMSMEAQLAEINEFARREGLDITRIFEESKSAKKPGRTVFNEMISAIYEKKDPVGIISWHPDRLARNSVDGGQIIYLIDIGKIVSLKFPTFWFEPTPQGLFMLQVAFGQSKYYSDNLSENVRRGIRQKIRRGEWATRAPVGYVNNPRTRNIEPDPVKSRIVKQGFEEFAEGRHSLESLRHRLHFLGLMSSVGKPLVKWAVHKMLTNPVYIGLIPHKGELHKGTFLPIVRKVVWDSVQKELKRRSKPRKAREGHNFPFTGLFECGECGCMITAQCAKAGKYIYYRCSKKRGRCTQAYVNSVSLEKQLRAKLEAIALPDHWAEIIQAEMESMMRKEAKDQHSFSQNLERRINDLDTKIDKLINTYLEGLIGKETFLKKKNELLERKLDLQERLDDFGKKGLVWVEPVREWLEAAQQAGKLASSQDLSEIKYFMRKIGSNRCLLDREVHWEVPLPFKRISEYRSRQGIGGEVGTAGGAGKEKDTLRIKEDVLLCRELLDEVR